MSKSLATVAASLLALGVLLLPSCSGYPHRDPTGERFPTVRGAALDGKAVTVPDDFSGAPLLLLIGYQQNSQFDLDRWLLALHQAGVQVRTFELPTIPGLVPGMFAGTIDSGMRRGIPAEDWGSVVTVYGDADAIAQFTGNAEGLPGRILLLDGAGRVVFFHDRGFSVGTLDRLTAALATLR